MKNKSIPMHAIAEYISDCEFEDRSDELMRRIRVYFKNGYGASIIQGDGSYGVELAVITREGLCYDTDISDDVIGNIETMEDLIGYLKRIEALPHREEPANEFW